MKCLRSIRARSLQIAMIQRGLTRHDLARMTGLPMGTISNVMSGLQGGPKSICAVEKAIGCPIFTPVSEADKLRRLEAVLGFDPRQVRYTVLLRSAAEHGLPGRIGLHKDELIDALADYLLRPLSPEKNHKTKHRRTRCHPRKK